MAANEMSLAPRGASDGAKARDRAAEFLLRRHRFRLAESLPWLIAIAVYFLFPDRLTFGSQVLIMILFALSLDMILGYAGIVTLGHAAFFGVGAYTVGLMAYHWGWSEPISGLFAAAITAAIVGFISGWFLLRYHGLTLLMLTLATAIMILETGNFRSDITGGYDGLPGLIFDPILGVFDYDLYGHTNYVYSLVVLAILFYFVRRIVYSPFGQALTGIRENVRRMHAIGSPVHMRLVTVYTIAAAVAGVAGALFAQTNAYVTLTVFDFEVSAKVMVMLILGGTGRLYGAFAGAAVYMVLEDHLSKLSPTFWQFGIGLLLLVTVLFARRGILGLLEDLAHFRFGWFGEHMPSLPRPAAWTREQWRGLGISTLDGALIGLVVGFAANLDRADLLLSWFTDYPLSVIAWAGCGALVVVAINVVYYMFTSRRAVEGQSR
jgi:branched-chain amino acid transport system permease protein